MWVTVKPSQTGCAISDGELYDSPHLVAPAGEDSNCLHVYLCGTNGQPMHYNTAFHLVRSSASMGCHTVALSYCYGKIADKERNERIQQAYPSDELQQQQLLESYHRDISIGGNGCSLLLSEIHETNSIIGRLRLLLLHLNWTAFVSADGALNYRQIIISGHSQGSGHACYLAKNFPFKKAVLISGPQELLAQNSLHNWIHGSYSCENIASFMHRDEEGTAELIRTNWGHIPALSCTDNSVIADISSLIQSSPTCATITAILRGKKSFLSTIEPMNYENRDGRPCHNSTATDKRTPQAVCAEYEVVIDDKRISMATTALYHYFWMFLLSAEEGL